jgi:hypothetical protein
MTEKEKHEIFIKFLNTGTAQWYRVRTKKGRLLSCSEMNEIERYADGMCQIAAKISAYLTYRGGAGFGDHGHDEALAKSEKSVKKIRKALEYAIP